MEIEVNGQNIYYEEFGNGQPVLFLHGWGATTKSWGTVLSMLGEKYRVIAIDFPGFAQFGGQSSTPKTAWTIKDYADMVLGFMDKMELEKINIVCHSFGGRVTIELANMVPERLNKLVLTDAAGVKPKRSLKYHAKVRAYKSAKWIYQHEIIRKICKAIGYDAEKRVKNAGSDEYKQIDGVVKQIFVHAVNYDQTALLKNIKNPTLLIWGDLDTDTPLYMAKTMESEIKDSGLVVFEGAGHFSYLQDIPRYVKILDVFFGG